MGCGASAKVANDEFHDIMSNFVSEDGKTQWEDLKKYSSFRQREVDVPVGVPIAPTYHDHQLHIQNLTRTLNAIRRRPQKLLKAVEQKRLKSFGEAPRPPCGPRVRLEEVELQEVVRAGIRGIHRSRKKPEMETEWFEELQDSRREQNADFMARRNQWLSERVIPALAKVSLLQGHDLSFLTDLAAPLIEKPFAAGEVIAQKAAETDAMLVLLDGEARIEVQNGKVIGEPYEEGSYFGEMAMLGLQPTNPATVRAATECRRRVTGWIVLLWVLHHGCRSLPNTRTLSVRRSALQRSLALPQRTAQEREDFQRIRAERIAQVEAGIPMTCLPVAVRKDDR
eukprot:g29553.t1